MDISLKLYKPFVACWNKMREKYGEEFEHLNGLHNSNLNFTDFIDNFIDSDNVANATIDSNANNSSKDIRTLMSEMNKPHTKLLSYNKIFYEIVKKYGLSAAEKWLEEEWSGGYYLHNASNSSLQPYCFSYDLDEIAEKGLFFINKFRTNAPKHLTTFNNHVLEFVSWTSNRTSGAVGLVSYFIYSYYFWMKDIENGYYLKDPETYRRQCFQQFIYDLNQPYLRVVECSFTNVTIMDRPYLEELFGGRTYPDGSFVIDYIEGIIEHQKVFMETVSEIRKETMMTFPVITYSLLFQNNKFVDEEFARWCNKHNMEWCDANFYVGNDVSTLAQCCRVLGDFSKLKGFINSIGGTSLKIGSVQVNTINLRRIAFEANNNEEKYLEILKDKVDLCIKVLDVIRHIIVRNEQKGLLPNYTHKLVNIENQFNTIGVNSLFECIENFGYVNTDEFGNKSYSEDGVRFASKILDYINELKDSYDFNYSINLEFVPGERCAVINCKKDSLLYNDDKYFIYSNQYIPLMQKCTLDEKIKLSALLDPKCGGGNILHANCDAPFTNEEQSWDLLNYIAKAGVIYFAYNLQISVCEDEHGFYGDICPKCGKPKVDTYQRVVGFLTGASTYSKERKLEHSKRYWYNLNDN